MPVESNHTSAPLENEVVISGISGRFPECESIEELKQKLLEGVDMVTSEETRWPAKLHELPARMGKVKTLDRFDAEFFGIHSKQAHVLDPQSRILLEVTYEAIVDAGYNPSELKQDRVGVFIGVNASDTGTYWRRSADTVSAYCATGTEKSMFANRISYSFDFNGPSISIDTACSSSMMAVQRAFASISAGECDAALVGGSNLCLQPTMSLQYQRLNMLSEDGKCKAFDQFANGFVRAETISAIFLQRAKKARRIYATILGAKTNTDGYKDLGVTFPSCKIQSKLMEEVYNEAGIKPASVSFVEAHGTGTQAGDPQELNAIAEVFCKNRKEPLPIGSIKSNLGHSETASGMCGIAKVVIAMECGILPRNLHYTSPNTQIAALNDGRLEVVVQNKNWSGGLIGINSFGFGGANVHVLLRSNPKNKKTEVPVAIPRLVTVSGRTHSAVCKLLDGVERNKHDIEFMALLNSVHSHSINGHGFRGYRLLGKENAPEIASVISEKRPIWYVYSGAGSQWPNMAKDMMKFEEFRNSIRECAKTLKPYGLDLEDLIMNASTTHLENVLNSLVAINAVQIALTDFLRALGIKPDGFVGHSAGEVACAYADEGLTREQTIKSAYQRGRAFLDNNLPRGKMAAVGLSLEECRKRCPPEIDIGCHNSKDNVTITGPENLVNDCVSKLTADGIFSRAVPSAGLAFHSKYIANAIPSLQKALDEIIPHPKSRSSKWISSSVPESEWNTLSGKLCSSEYLTTNVIAPVLFYEALQHIPKNAIVIEIAPHGLLQAILKRTLHSECTNISLVSRSASNNVDFFLSAIGKIFNAGAQPQIARMYPPVQYPVSRGTTMINSLIEWDHSEKWTVVNFAEQSSTAGEFNYTIDLTKEPDQFIAGHKLNGKIVFPGTGYLVMAWRTLAKLRNEDFEQMPVVIEDVKFKRATKMSMDAVVKFSINILQSSGEFEIYEGASAVASGKIFVPRDVSKEFVHLPQGAIKTDTDLLLTAEDIYKEFRLRGYDHERPFQLIESSDNRFVNGIIKFQSNWVIYLDALLQFTVLNQKAKDLYLPTRIRRVVINPKLHLASNNSIPISMFPKTGVAQSGGVQIQQVKWSMSRKPLDLVAPKLEKYKFIPYDDVTLSSENALIVLTQIVLENTDALKLRVIEMLQDTNIEKTFHIKEAIEAEPKLSVDYAVIKLIETNTAEFETKQIQVLPKKMVDQFKANIHLVVMKDAQSPSNFDLTKSACAALKPGGFLLSEEQEFSDTVVLQSLGLKVVATHSAGMTNFVLLRKPLEIQRDLVVLQITGKNFKWVTPLAQALQKSATDGTKIFLVSQGDEFSGLVGLMNCLRKEPGGMNVRAYYIPKKTKETFSVSSPYYQNQIERDLIHNVLKNEIWGTYRHLLLDRNIVASNHAYINIGTIRDLSTLRWVDGPHHSPGDASDLCSVYYASINFRDVMLATGQLASDALPGKYGTHECLMGLEFSGRDSKGRRVMGLVRSRGLALTCIPQPHLLWEVPKKWTLEEAATVPLVYGTVYYALIIRGQLQPGESILIHSGAGGVGQAAISVALSMGCTVFTTVGNQSKRTFLKHTFPQLHEEHIGNSRDASFEQLVLNETDGHGVDVVLNSLSGDLLQASVRCLALGGRFLEIGKVDLFNDSLLGMNTFLKNTTFHGILFDAIIEKDNHHAPRIIQLINDGIASGVVRPLPSTVFGEDQAENAFRLMGSGKHIGKILLKMRTEELQRVFIPPPKVKNCLAHTYMNPKRSYVVVGGLDGFGLELTNWLILRGATKIVLCCNGVTTGYQSLCIRRWREDGATIAISSTDFTNELGVYELFKEALHHGPIGGVFNLAAVLKDAQMVNLSAEDFEAVCQPKIQGTKHLDTATRALAPNLDHFVVFSSICAGRGGMGQANYGFANSAMERICESRQADGLPGLAIQWDTVDDVDILKKVDESSLEDLKVISQRMRSCSNTMDVLMNQPHAIVASMVLRKNVKVDKEIGVSDVVGNILGIKDFKTVSPTMVFTDLGMDSLMVSEIKQTLEKNYDMHLNMDEVRSLTFERLSLLSIAK